MGCKVLVCRMMQAKSLGILDKLEPSTAKIHSYNSISISLRKFTFKIASIIQQYPNSFKRIGKKKDYQVKFYSDKKKIWQFP